MLTLLSALLLSQPTRYAIDPAQTELVALTAPVGLFAGASHPHLIVARKVQGEVVYDPAAAEACSVSLQFPADALENDDPAQRKRFGFSTNPSAEDRKTIAANLRAQDQLDVKTYATVTFASKRVRRVDAERLEVSGTMTLRGVPVELTLPVRVAVKDGVLRGEGSIGVTHAMFGFRPYSVALGTVRNAEEISLRLTIVGRAPPTDGGGEPRTPSPGTD